jgi:hypothetical protein
MTPFMKTTLLWLFYIAAVACGLVMGLAIGAAK